MCRDLTVVSLQCGKLTCYPCYDISEIPSKAHCKHGIIFGSSTSLAVETLCYSTAIAWSNMADRGSCMSHSILDTPRCCYGIVSWTPQLSIAGFLLRDSLVWGLVFWFFHSLICNNREIMDSDIMCPSIEIVDPWIKIANPSIELGDCVNLRGLWWTSRSQSSIKISSIALRIVHVELHLAMRC